MNVHAGATSDVSALERLEVGGWRLEVGGWRLEGGGWRVEGGGWRVEGGGWRLCIALAARK